jgi:hypothetical protein
LTRGKAGHITKSVEALDVEDFEAFARWFAELQADRWDRPIEADAIAGKLDWLVEEARREMAAGETRPL